MLEKLLARISQGGIYSTHSLARELGVSQELVEAMLEDLVRAGRLQAIDACETHSSDHRCSSDRRGSCDRCGRAGSCQPCGKFWRLSRIKGD
jgi:hypothetical protein